MTTPLLELHRLSAGYPGQRVLHAIDLTLDSGAIATVTGANAAGKSTLINTVAGHVPATAGRIVYDGSDITSWPAHRRAHAGIALVPQGKALFASLTVAEHLHLATADRSTRDEVLDRLPHLRTRLRHKPGQLSGGEQQMLALARALARKPRLLLLDEPGEGLATAVATDVASILTNLAATGTAVLITEHRTMHLADSPARYCLDRGVLAALHHHTSEVTA